MKYNGCDKNLTQKYHLLNNVEVMENHTAETYSILSSTFTVDRGGGSILNFDFKFRNLGTPK